MSNYVIYARKSSESEERQALSIKSQIAEIESLAARKGIVISKTFQESYSAKEPGRPVFGQLMNEVQRNQVEGILCWKLDRLARNPVDGASLIWALSKKTISEIILPHRTFTGSADDKLIMQIEFGMATKYVDDLSENVKRGNRAKLKQGWRPGRVPMGYLNEQRTHTIIPDPERFNLVRQMWDMLLSGHTIVEILNTANKKWGLRTPLSKRLGGRPLTYSLVYNMFSNIFYSGIIVSNGKVYRGSHKPIVTPEEFNLARRALGRFKSAKKIKKYSWAYTRLIHCGVCGRLVTAERKTKPSGKKYVYYHCSRGRPCEGRCRQPSVRSHEIERQIVKFVETITMPTRFLSWALAQFRKQLMSQKSLEETLSQSLQKKKDFTEKELTNLTILRTRNLIGDEEFIRQRKRILEEQISLDSKLASSDIKEEAGIGPAIRLIQFMRCAQKIIVKGSKYQKREVFKAIASNPILKDKKLLVSAKKPFLLLKNSSGEFNKLGDLSKYQTYLARYPNEVELPEGPWKSQDLETLLDYKID